MPSTDFVELFEGADLATRADLLRARFRYDVGGFLKWCFPDLFGREWNPFHREVLKLDDLPVEERERDTFRAWAAPRGIAKTTLAKGRAAHAIVYGIERFFVVLSAETRLARAISEHVRTWFLEKTSPLAELYGPFEVTGGKEEWNVRVRGGPKRGMLARSFGTQVRGCNLDGIRPGRVLVDDGERPDRVRNPDQRTLWQTFLDDDVLRAGPLDGGLIVDWLGTVLHPDAILARILKSPAWQGRKYSALISWPERTDLWDRCGEIYKDLSLGAEPLRYACARAFYDANREEMDRGAAVLDEAALPLFAFYLTLWQRGLRSVLRELQNEPRDPNAAIFTSETFARCRVVDGHKPGERVIVNANGRRIPLADCRLHGWWDPSLGDAEGDFAALGVLARDRWGYGYLLDAWMKRAPKSRQLEALWAMAERWRCTRWGVESNGFQRHLAGDFRRERTERQESQRFWQVQIDEVVTTENKDERISNLEVPLSNDWLQVAEGISQEGLLQFDDFPNGDHDDFPDMVEAVWTASGGVTPAMVTDKRVR